MGNELGGDTVGVFNQYAPAKSVPGLTTVFADATETPPIHFQSAGEAYRCRLSSYVTNLLIDVFPISAESSQIQWIPGWGD